MEISNNISKQFIKELKTTSVIIVERVSRKLELSKNISKQYMKVLKTTNVTIVKRVFHKQ